MQSSDNPLKRSFNRDYITTVKHIEAFSMFFERISQDTVNPDKSLDKLRVFKKILYDNIENHDKVNQYMDEIIGESQQAPQKP